MFKWRPIETLDAFGKLGVEAIKNDLNKVNATGKTVDSVRYETKREGTVDRLTFYAREYTSLLEKGIRPTKKEPIPSREMIESLTEYARVRGFENPKSAAWGIAKKILIKGDDTHRKGGRIVYSKTLDKLTKNIKKELTKNFVVSFTQSMKASLPIILVILSSCGSIQTMNGVRIDQRARHKSSERIFLECSLGCAFILYGITGTQPWK